MHRRGGRNDGPFSGQDGVPKPSGGAVQNWASSRTTTVVCVVVLIVLYLFFGGASNSETTSPSYHVDGDEKEHTVHPDRLRDLADRREALNRAARAQKRLVAERAKGPHNRADHNLDPHLKDTVIHTDPSDKGDPPAPPKSHQQLKRDEAIPSHEEQQIHSRHDDSRGEDDHHEEGAKNGAKHHHHDEGATAKTDSTNAPPKQTTAAPPADDGNLFNERPSATEHKEVKKQPAEEPSEAAAGDTAEPTDAPPTTAGPGVVKQRTVAPALPSDAKSHSPCFQASCSTKDVPFRHFHLCPATQEFVTQERNVSAAQHRRFPIGFEAFYAPPDNTQKTKEEEENAMASCPFDMTIQGRRLDRSDIQACVDPRYPVVAPLTIHSLLSRSAIACYGVGDMVCNIVGRSGGWEAELTYLLSNALKKMRSMRIDQLKQYREALRSRVIDHYKEAIEGLAGQLLSQLDNTTDDAPEAWKKSGDATVQLARVWRARHKIVHQHNPHDRGMRGEQPQPAQSGDYKGPPKWWEGGGKASAYSLDKAQTSTSDEIPPHQITEANYGVEYMDIGGNVGSFIYFIWRHGFPVKAFEALPQNMQLLSMSKCVNGVRDPEFVERKPQSAFKKQASTRVGPSSGTGRKTVQLVSKELFGKISANQMRKCLLKTEDELTALRAKFIQTVGGAKDDFGNLDLYCPDIVEADPIQLFNAGLGATRNMHCVMMSEATNFGDTWISCDPKYVNSPKEQPFESYIRRGDLLMTTLDSIAGASGACRSIPGINSTDSHGKANKFGSCVAVEYTEEEREDGAIRQAAAGWRHEALARQSDVLRAHREAFALEAALRSKLRAADSKQPLLSSSAITANPSSASFAEDMHVLASDGDVPSFPPLPDVFEFTDYIVKIDVEGHEIAVMEGASAFLRQPFRPKMILSEVWGKLNVTRYGEVMLAAGYWGFVPATVQWMKGLGAVIAYDRMLKRTKKPLDNVVWIIPDYASLLPDYAKRGNHMWR